MQIYSAQAKRFNKITQDRAEPFFHSNTSAFSKRPNALVLKTNAMLPRVQPYQSATPQPSEPTQISQQQPSTILNGCLKEIDREFLVDQSLNFDSKNLQANTFLPKENQSNQKDSTQIHHFNLKTQNQLFFKET